MSIVTTGDHLRLRRVPAVVALALGLGAWSVGHASGQDLAVWQTAIAIVPTTSPFAAPYPPPLTAEQVQRALPHPIDRPNRTSPLMASLYVSTAVMQALDVHSSLSAFHTGASEANSLMRGVAKNPAAFMVVKAGVAAGTILAAGQLSKRSKVAAVTTLIAINSAYAMVVSHNYRVARSMK